MERARLIFDTPPRCGAALTERYNRAAPSWHPQVSALGFQRAYAETLRRFPMSLPQSAHVLDVGVGTGALSLALAQLHPKVSVTGVDLSPEMLKEARGRFQQKSVRFRACLADARSLPLPEGCCDAVVSAHMLEHLPDPRPALGEMLRVLKPGAPLLLIVTRRGLLGRLVQSQWEVRTYKFEEFTRLVAQVGFTHTRRVELVGAPLPPLMSFGVFARTPFDTDVHTVDALANDASAERDSCLKLRFFS